MIKIFLRNKLLILVFIFFLVVFTFSFFNTCTVYSSNDFDSQARMMWDYLSGRGYMPYKDVYYPYGILTYFKNSSHFFNLLYIILLSSLFSIVFNFLNRLWNNKIFSYPSFIIFFVFIAMYVGFDSFSRYGIILDFTLLYSLYFSKKSYLPLQNILLFGIANGMIFGLVTDQSIYSSVFFILFQTINPIIRLGVTILQKSTYYLQILRNNVIFLVSFLIGTLPFLMYAKKTNILVNFLSNIKADKDIFYYAKIDYFSNVATPENIFTFIILFLSICYLCYLFFYKNFDKALSSYMILFLTFILLFLEQKNIVRSNTQDIIPVALVLLLALLYKLYVYKTDFNISTIKYYIFLIFILTISIIYLPINNSYLRTLNYFGTCMTQSKANLLKKDNSLLKLITELNKIRQKNDRIYSYPGDPIIYILSQSALPYYFSTYEGSPYYAQLTRIEFLENKNTRFVVINTSLPSIQDGVPEYARSGSELQYILTHFQIRYHIGNYLILQRNENNASFTNINLSLNLKYFNKYLLNIDLKAIPKSEGLYKIKYINQLKKIFVTNSYEKLNEFLQSHPTLGRNIILVILSKSSNEHIYNRLTLQSKNNIITNVIFEENKKTNYLILNFSRIPMFYSDFLLNKIEYSDSKVVYTLYLMPYKPRSIW